MASIHFPQHNNPALFNGNVVGHLVRSSSTGADIYTICGSGQTPGFDSVLEIYQGAVPTFPELTNASTRVADLLISFSIANPSSVTTIVGSDLRQLLGKRLVDTAASATGVATWFLMRRNNTTALNTSGGIIGTIGLLGSSADLEVPNTSIVSGQFYQSAGFTMSWSLSRTL